MLPIIGFCGAAGSGKTTLVSQVVADLCGRGLQVGVIKHHGHVEPLPVPAEWRGKDSLRHQAAGAAASLVSHAGGVFLTAPARQDDPLSLANQYLAWCDLVLVEGYKTACLAKIEVVAAGAQPLWPTGGQVIALATPGGDGIQDGRPVLDANAPTAVACFVLDWLAQANPHATPDDSVVLEVDGRRLPLNPFVAQFVAGTLRGLTKSLKGGENARHIQLRLE